GIRSGRLHPKRRRCVAGSSDGRSPMARWVAVLEAFLDRDAGGVRGLGAFTGMSPSATHRLLHEMARHGLLTAGVERGQFHVGPELNRIAVLLAERLRGPRLRPPPLAA